MQLLFFSDFSNRPVFLYRLPECRPSQEPHIQKRQVVSHLSYPVEKAAFCPACYLRSLLLPKSRTIRRSCKSPEAAAAT